MRTSSHCAEQSLVSAGVRRRMQRVTLSSHHLGGPWQGGCQGIPGVPLTSSPRLSAHLQEKKQALLLLCSWSMKPEQVAHFDQRAGRKQGLVVNLLLNRSRFITLQIARTETADSSDVQL